MNERNACFARKAQRHSLAAVLLVGLVLAAAAYTRAAEPRKDLEIWLLEGRDCGACELYRSFHNGYSTELTGYPGADGPIPISVVSKAAIPDAVADQFIPHDYWSGSLSVMVLDDGKVLYVGNISEGSDIAHARFPDAIMAPDSAADRERAAHSTHFYRKFFEATWNLDYFVDVALGRRDPYLSTAKVMLGQTRPLDGVAQNNVILWGSTSTPIGNSLYISERMHDVYQVLEEVAGPSLNFIALYGNGDSPEPDTSTLVGGEVRYIEASVQPAMSATLSPDAETMGRLFHSLENTHNNLLVQIGHSGPVGAPLWGHLVTVDAPLLEKLVDTTGSDLVMVSGACNGGQFAKAPNCGFFAAHPQVVATGCQKTPEALRTSDDYLGNFFSGLASGAADLDGDGKTSFIEAHWYASVSLEDHQIPYDSIDVLVDDFWQSNAAKLPAEIEFSRLLELAGRFGTREEQWAVRTFEQRVPADMSITTMHALEINLDALRKVSDRVEASSAARNAKMALEYPLVLSSLARRLIWRSISTVNEASEAIEHCAEQGIADFVLGAVTKQ